MHSSPRIVVVTGASAGIGRATAVEFGRHGWRVALLARGVDGVQGAKLDIERVGAEAMIVETDVAARAVYFAATHRRRELWVGWPAIKAILGTRVVPGYLDRRLARTAVAGQHTDQPLPPDRQDNLYTPVAGDHGAHGRFDAEAIDASAALWVVMHPAVLLVALAVVLLAAIAGVLALL